MSVRGSRGAPAAWRAREEALLHEERLVHFLERARILTHGGSDGGEPDRSTTNSRLAVRSGRGS